VTHAVVFVYKNRLTYISGTNFIFYTTTATCFGFFKEPLYNSAGVSNQGWGLSLL